MTVLFMKEPNETVLLEHSLNIASIIIDFQSLERTMKIIKDKEVFQMLFIPIIVFNNTSNPLMRKVSYLHGVDDYISNYIDMYEVSIRIERLIERKRQLDMVLFLDEPMGVYNDKYLKPIYSRFINLERSFALVLIELDCESDDESIIQSQVLRKFVRTVNHYIGESDFIIRLNNEQFLLVLPLSTSAKAIEKVEDISSEFSTIKFSNEDKTFTCTFYTGILEVLANDINIIHNIKKVNTLLNQAIQTNENKFE